MIDTPKTDNRSFYNEHGEWVNSAFARQLERELNAANERIKRLEAAGDEMERYIFDQTNTRWIICAIQWREAKEAKP